MNSYHTIILVDKEFRKILDRRKVASLNLAICSVTDRVRDLHSKIFLMRNYYNRRLQIYGIDLSETVKKCLLKLHAESDRVFRRPLVKRLVFMRDTERFHTSQTLLGEIAAELQKSVNKEASITKFLKIVRLLKYCRRKDVQKELVHCFGTFVSQCDVYLAGDRLHKQLGIKLTVDILRVFCITDFMKLVTISFPYGYVRHFLLCSKGYRYNFCGIFQKTETKICPIASTLLTNKLSTLEFLLEQGARNLYSSNIHKEFFQVFYANVRSIAEQYNWPHNLQPFNKRNYLYMQVVYLFILRIREIESTLPTKIVKLLWKSIPDPFLTKGELLLPYENKSERGEIFLIHCWRWYFINAIYPETSGGTRRLMFRSPEPYGFFPRSLKHIARCEVRSMLNANYIAIMHLTGVIPRELQEYLLI